MKEYTEDEIRNKAEAYCSVAERCISEVRSKLQQWGLPLEREEAVLQYLQTEKFIDEQRYSIAFVRDKYRFNSWGRVKIAQALKLKRIPSVCISKALEEIDDEEYKAFDEEYIKAFMEYTRTIIPIYENAKEEVK